MEITILPEITIQEILYSVYALEPKGWNLVPVRKLAEILNISKYQVRKWLRSLQRIGWVYADNGLPLPAPYRGGYRLTESGYNDITVLIKEVEEEYEKKRSNRWIKLMSM